MKNQITCSMRNLMNSMKLFSWWMENIRLGIPSTISMNSCLKCKKRMLLELMEWLLANDLCSFIKLILVVRVTLSEKRSGLKSLTTTITLKSSRNTRYSSKTTTKRIISANSSPIRWKNSINSASETITNTFWVWLSSKIKNIACRKTNNNPMMVNMLITKQLLEKWMDTINRSTSTNLIIEVMEIRISMITNWVNQMMINLKFRTQWKPMSQNWIT